MQKSLSDESSPSNMSPDAGDDDPTSTDHSDTEDGFVKSEVSAEPSDQSESGSIYEDEDEQKATEEARVTALIVAAEQVASNSSTGSTKKANAILKSAGSRHSTRQLSTTVNVDINELWKQARTQSQDTSRHRSSTIAQQISLPPNPSEEQRLSLAVSKADFRSMQIVGQFNLGFILAVRPTTTMNSSSAQSQRFQRALHY